MGESQLENAAVACLDASGTFIITVHGIGPYDASDGATGKLMRVLDEVASSAQGSLAKYLRKSNAMPSANQGEIALRQSDLPLLIHSWTSSHHGSGGRIEVFPDHEKPGGSSPKSPRPFHVVPVMAQCSASCGHQHHLTHRKIFRYFLFPGTGAEFMPRRVSRDPDPAQEIPLPVTVKNELGLCGGR
jgi:hypothetical protein